MNPDDESPAPPPGPDDDLLLLDDDPAAPGASRPPPAEHGGWQVLVVDDEAAVHTVTRLALDGFRVEDRPVRLLHAHSAADAQAVLAVEPDCALVLLDVVMETDDAGLRLARWIRESLGNHRVRIVLRTGQPGMAPEEAVMTSYDIHDYYAKPEITARRLRTAVTGGLRAWRDLQALSLQREALERAQHTIVRSLREKETLLKEIHHRVKNNLQIISGLLQLQGDRMPSEEARALIQESVLRVRSMALIHQHLYGVESLDRVDLGDYASVLAESLRSLLAPSVRLQVDAAVTEVALDDAIPAGLILNELVTNAFKYGIRRPGAPAPWDGPARTGADCDVRIEVDRVDGAVRVAVADAGDGLPAGFDLDRATSLGLYLVRALARQLRGQVTWDADRGARFVLTFQPRPIGARS
jgi:two-component sensor histidine kinase